MILLLKCVHIQIKASISLTRVVLMEQGRSSIWWAFDSESRSVKKMCGIASRLPKSIYEKKYHERLHQHYIGDLKAMHLRHVNLQLGKIGAPDSFKNQAAYQIIAIEHFAL